MLEGLQGIAGDPQPVGLTLYTDAYVIRGTIQTRQRRVTDILNDSDHDFIVLTDTVLDEYGSRAPAVRAEYAQVNLASVLFAAAETSVEAMPELRTPKVPELAMVSIPPFRIVGRIHLLPERNLKDALEELVGRFVPVTDAAFWSESLGEARQTAPMIAFNHARAQLLAPHREVDPWEGLDRGAGGRAAGVDETFDRAPDAVGSVPTDVASTSTAPGVQDPWGLGQPSQPAGDPWRDTPSRGGPALRSPAEPGRPSNPWGGPGGDPWGAGRQRRDDESSG